MEIREDRWFSERFGHPVFTVLDPGDDPESLAGHAGGGGAATYQAKVDVRDLRAVAMLEKAGMHIVNVSVTLARDPAASVGHEPPRVEVREMDPERDEALLDIAERTFRYTRFHLDPGISQAVADRIKRDWVWSYLHRERGEELLVAVQSGRPVGFLAVLARGDAQRRVGVIDLIGVASEARSQGAGNALVRHFHERAAGRYSAVEVGTQLANARALAFYERLGYVTTGSAFDLHMHVR